ncbi:hypothetical protein ACHAW6_003623 [Cyclotella cf. meneghiniana]
MLCAQLYNHPLWIRSSQLRIHQDLMHGRLVTPRTIEIAPALNTIDQGQCLKLWSLKFPCGLMDKLGLFPGLVAWLMFGVYQIGHTIEDTFQGSLLRVTDMRDAIYRDVI